MRDEQKSDLVISGTGVVSDFLLGFWGWWRNLILSKSFSEMLTHETKDLLADGDEQPHSEDAEQEETGEVPSLTTITNLVRVTTSDVWNTISAFSRAKAKQILDSESRTKETIRFPFAISRPYQFPAVFQQNPRFLSSIDDTISVLFVSLSQNVLPYNLAELEIIHESLDSLSCLLPNFEYISIRWSTFV